MTLKKILSILEEELEFLCHMSLKIIFIFFALFQQGASYASEYVSPSTSPGYVHSGIPSPQIALTVKELPLIPSLALPATTKVAEVGFKTPPLNKEKIENRYLNLPNPNPLFIIENKISDDAYISQDCQKLRYFKNSSFDSTSDLLVDFVKSKMQHLSEEERSNALHARIYDHHLTNLSECVQTMQAMAQLEIPIDCTYFLFINEQLEAFIDNNPNRHYASHHFSCEMSYCVTSMKLDHLHALCRTILMHPTCKFLFDCFLCELGDTKNYHGDTFCEIFRNFVIPKKFLKDQPTLLNKLLYAHMLTEDKRPFQS